MNSPLISGVKVSDNCKKDTILERNQIGPKRPLGPTATDWKTQVMIIRKNHNIVDKRRLKRLERI